MLVTEASGYVAAHVVQQLLSSGKYRVRGTVTSLMNEEEVMQLMEMDPNAKYPLDLIEADLQNKESWPPAVQGCTYVLYIAPPLPEAIRNNRNEAIRFAVDGTLNVLTACAESGCVKKISLGILERVAWDFIKELPEKKNIDLAVINHGFLQGPALTKGSGALLAMTIGMLAGKLPALPDIILGMVDVRDVAQAHIVAMEKPECNGNRHLLVGENNVSFQQVMQWMAAEFGPQGYKVGTGKVPKILTWVISKFNSDVKHMYPMIAYL